MARTRRLWLVLGLGPALVGCGAAPRAELPPPPPRIEIIYVPVPVMAPPSPTSAAVPSEPPPTGQASPEAPLAPAPVFAPPPPRAVDASLPRPFQVDLVGANATHAWLSMKTLERPVERRYSGVLELASGCVVESYPDFERIAELERLDNAMAFWPGGRDGARPLTAGERALGSMPSAAKRQARAKALLAEPAVQVEIRAYLGLAQRFGLDLGGKQSLGDWAFSHDGSKIVATLAGALFRSKDGGQSYEMLDDDNCRRPYVTRDGRYAFYERGTGDAARQARILETREAKPARQVPLGRGTIEGLDASGQKLVFIKDDEANKVVVTHLDPATGTFTRAFSIPARARPAGAFFTIDPSPGGAYGTHDGVEYPTARPLWSKLTLVSMVDGGVLHTFEGEFIGSYVDDTGRVAWYTGSVTNRTRVGTPQGKVREAGAGGPLGWAPNGRLLVYDTPKPPAGHPAGTLVPQPQGTLGSVACKLVRVAQINP